MERDTGVLEYIADFDRELFLAVTVAPKTDADIFSRVRLDLVIGSKPPRSGRQLRFLRSRRRVR